MPVVKTNILTLAYTERNIANIPEIVSETSFHHLSFVFNIKNEIFIPVKGVSSHDVPGSWHSPIGTIGFGRYFVSSRSLIPVPTQSFTTFIMNNFHGHD